MSNKQVPDEDGAIYTRYITLRNGRRIYAPAYGLRVFRIIIKPKD